MRTRLLFNDDWLFLPAEVSADRPDADFTPVTLPHSNIILPHHNFDNQDYQFTSTYRKRFRLPQPRAGRQVTVEFDGAMIACTVSLNGHTLGDHEGGFTPFSFDITPYLNESGDNLLTVHLDSSERPDIPPYGGVVDYLTFGGIYRDVWLRYTDPCEIRDLFVQPQNVLSDDLRLGFDIHLANRHPRGITGRARIAVTDAAGQYLARREVSFQVSAGGSAALSGQFDRADFAAPPALWSLDEPALYDFEVSIAREDSGGALTLLDSVRVRFGFREARFSDDGSFYLNGQPLKLIGLNRHQTYPYIGAAAPARLQRRDADIVKFELGCNIVRTSHYPQSPHFLDRCDEIGLLVFEEIPGWQHIGDDDWQGISLRDVEAMIVRDRNHPSIVLWGVRINESWDNTAFYTRTNELAHQLDPTRQTGGVRFFMESEFLEDVYTFNDFSNDVREPLHTPHLVTEFNGHMFPTKVWDGEDRLLEHALRHARIQNKQMGMARVAGAIGWCAFDYNTHAEFGSGDRICYHGVMDIFRLPKYAAHFYGSQISPRQRVVLQAATAWTMGDRSEGGIDPLVIFSNCDEVEVYTGGTLFKRFKPDTENYPHLPHPPFTVRGLGLLWGGRSFDDLRLVGYINGEAVAEQRMAAGGLPSALLLTLDDAELRADGADMTRLAFSIVDKYGSRLPFTNQIVSFELAGPAELIGENPFAVMGGQAALYVKAQRQPGTVTIRATTPRLPPAEVTLTLI